MWFTTAGFQMFQEKYLFEAKNYKEQALRIAKTAAQHTESPKKWEKRFFKLIWNGWVSCSTPVLANMGTDRGLPVSCSGQYIGDSVDEFYGNLRETALLTKYGFGTSGYLGDIRPRGSKIAKGGFASGTQPVFTSYVQCMRYISQGNTRRGAWAGYYPIDGGDFFELADYVKEFPDDANIGWVVTDAFIDKLNEKDIDAIARFLRALKVKMVTGKGYFFFADKVNRNRPETYKQLDLGVKSSNLCTEIFLHQDKDHTYTCVLSSMNIAKYQEWKDTDAVFWATVFLDCVAEEFIQKAKRIKGLEKAVRFTEKGRALGLGACGFHTYLQENNIPFESLEAQFFNANLFKEIRAKAEEATEWMAKEYGEPEWCKGHGRRNTHLLAIAPTMSTALIMGGISQGIEPILGNAFIQSTAAGEVERVNPAFLKLAKKKGKYTKKMIKDVAENYGSVQHLDWLDDHEKLVFRTAFEINPEVIIRLAAQRQKSLDQGQSLNLFFSADESEAVIAKVHQLAFKEEGILSLYYVRTQAGVAGSSGECISCT